jgi:hypothetical protein
MDSRVQQLIRVTAHLRTYDIVDIAVCRAPIGVPDCADE